MHSTVLTSKSFAPVMDVFSIPVLNDSSGKKTDEVVEYTLSFCQALLDSKCSKYILLMKKCMITSKCKTTSYHINLL